MASSEAPSAAGSALTPFGFTGLESQIYAFLVAESPATGYRIAQAIGKPVANTYKAIQTLQAKGAIVVEDGDARLCRAIPSDELLGRLAREFEQRTAAARATFTQIARGDDDDRIYSLRSRGQVMHRATAMLADSRSVALAAGPAAVLAELAAGFGDAGARGVEVSIKSDSEFSVPRVDAYVVQRDDDLLKHGSYFRLVVDARQCLAGRLDLAGDAVEMTWTRSRTLSALIHEGLSAEITLLAIAERIEDGAGPKRLVRVLGQIRSASAVGT